MHRVSTRLVALVAPARWALRQHRRSAAVVAIAAGLAVGAILPLRLSGALQYTSVRDTEWPIRSSPLLATPSDTQRHAVTDLAALARGIAVAAMLAAAVTILVTAVARARARGVDIGIRRAVGASRRVLAGTAMLEAAVIAGAGLIAGAAIAAVIERVLVTTWPGTVAGGPTGGVLAPILVIGGLVILGGLMPLVHARHRAAPPVVGDEPLWLPVPATQFAIALVLLVLAAQLARAATAPAQAAGGASSVGTVAAVTPRSASSADRAIAYHALLTAQHDRTSMASLTSPGMLLGLGRVDIVITDCGWCSQGGIMVPHHAVPVVHHLVSADTFRAIGLPVLAGRGITDVDAWEAPRVAVVSRRLARDHFQDGQAVGRLIRVGRGTDEWYAVVGIVADRAPSGFGGQRQPPHAVYLSVLQHPPGSADLLVPATDSPPRTLSAVADVDVGRPEALEDLRHRESAPTEWFARLIRLEGWLAVLAAAFGMFAAMRLWVTGLLPELGLRRAVGAPRHRILGHVAARALAVTCAGVVVAAWAGPMVSDAARGVVAGLSSWDPRLAAQPLAMLASVTLLAALGPAWGAVSRTPAATLEQRGS